MFETTDLKLLRIEEMIRTCEAQIELRLRADIANSDEIEQIKAIIVSMEDEWQIRYNELLRGIK